MSRQPLRPRPTDITGQIIIRDKPCASLATVHNWGSWRGVIFRMDQVLHLQPISLIVMSPPLAPRSLPAPRAQCLKAASHPSSG